MKPSRFLPCVVAVLVAITLTAGCSRGPSEEEIAQAQFQEQLTQLQTQYEDLQQRRADLAAAETTLAEIAAIKERDRTEEQKAEFETLPATIDELTAERDASFDVAQGALADFLNVALNDFPDDPATVAGLNIYADEAILIADDTVLKAGDYKKATDQLGSAVGYYESLSIPVYPTLAEKLTEFEELRFINKDRFDLVTKNMTMDEVKEIVGVPYYQNIQLDEKRGVETWLYRKEDGGAAAIYFKTKNGKTYDKKWDAVKTKVVTD
jgi:outer membrane murein-binding lipoprotein Lpp